MKSPEPIGPQLEKDYVFYPHPKVVTLGEYMFTFGRPRIFGKRKGLAFNVEIVHPGMAIIIRGLQIVNGQLRPPFAMAGKFRQSVFYLSRGVTKKLLEALTHWELFTQYPELGIHRRHNPLASIVAWPEMRKYMLESSNAAAPKNRSGRVAKGLMNVEEIQAL